jgi:hypothetical protein
LPNLTGYRAADLPSPIPESNGIVREAMTHKTIDRIIKLASSIANDAEAAVNCRPGVADRDRASTR